MTSPVRLQPDERTLCHVRPSKWWTLSRYVFTLGAWAFWRGRHDFVLTDRRVVVARGILSRTEQSVPLSRIQDVQVTSSVVVGGWIVLSTAGGPAGVERIGPLVREDAEAFAERLLPRIGTQRDPAVAVP